MPPRPRFYYRDRALPRDRSLSVQSLGIHERMPPGLIAHGGPGAAYLLMAFHDPALVEVDGRTVAAEGAFICWDADAWHRYGHADAAWDHSWINVHGTAVAEALARERIPLNRPLPGVPAELSERYLGLLHAECHGRHPPDAGILAGLIGLWLREVALLRRDEPQERPERERMLAARRQLAAHLDQPLRLEDVARDAGLSVSQFSLLFRRSFGSSPMRHLAELRMQAARRLLEQTALPVKDVAARVGFEDPLYFSRQFSRHVGQSPSAYRAQRQGHVG